MIIKVNVGGVNKLVNDLTSTITRVDGAVEQGVNATAMVGEELGKGILSSHIFTGNAFVSWKWLDTGKYSAIITYLNTGIPHPTGERTSAYFFALEYGRRGYLGSPNKIASGNSGDYTYPHYKVGPAGGIFMVSQTAESLRAVFPQIMSTYVGAAL